MEPVRPNTISTGVDTAAGVSHVGTPHDIESTSPLAPGSIDTLSQTLERIPEKESVLGT